MHTKFGIIGCGGIANRFAGALKLAEGAELYAAAARELPRAREFAKLHGAQKAYGDYLELIKDDKVEIVYIALVHNLHFEVAKLCVEHDKAVICEKPFFVSEQEAVALASLAKEKGVLIMEAMWTHCLPAYLKAKAWAHSGAIGQIKYIDAAFCFRVPLTEETKENRLYNPNTAGGALLDAGVYPYEFITGMLDEKPAEIKAVVQKAPTGVDETVAMSLRFASGVLANAATSIGVRTGDTAHIYGTEGHILLYDFLRCRKCELRNAKNEVVDTFSDPQEEGFVYEIEHVADLYRRGLTESPLIPVGTSVDFAAAVEKIRAQCGI